MVAALSRNRVIGRDGSLPWRLPDDLKHFVRVTLGKTVLMGRRTFESIGAQPLAKRHNIVLTRDRSYQAEGATVVHSLEAALEAAAHADELVILGGEKIYEAFLPRAERLYLTFVDAELPGDTYFPEVDFSEWVEVDRLDHPADERHCYPFHIVELERREVA